MAPLTALRALARRHARLAGSDACQPITRLYSSMATGCHCAR